ncbi:MAG: pantoate--beta-alanine ligase [Acidobacteriales bacterium 59-55]|nr:pantoate--beta-alanine ligase [Terriglobales bacterium]OJV39718.1 MAG: pantoate--beta-alanine ligase [Acidobacteriales bacterium 59-55]
MKIAETVVEMRRLCRDLRSAKGLLALVPTMGALHEGHLSLARRARAECGAVAASIFVNPLQFGPNEDFSKYPRAFADDCARLEAEGVDILFAPGAAEMYPEGAVTKISVDGIGDRLDGASRPGHFTGVATVVAKLFHVTEPDRAYFGQKDAAQLAVLRQMVRDLNFGVEVVACPIVRDADRLALSSRNKYLSASDRQHALALHRALQAMEARLSGGERSSKTLVEEGTEVLRSEAGVRVDYVAAVDAQTLLPVERAEAGTLLAVAAWVGQTRLIDNVVAA